MSTEAADSVIQRIEVLRKRGNYTALFPRMSESEIDAFEFQYQIQLPLSYKLFLQHIGNGIRVNQYFIIPLTANYNSEFGYQNDFMHLKHEFLYTKKWLRKEYDEFRSWYLTTPEDVSFFVDIHAVRRSFYEENKTDLDNQTTLFDTHTFYEGDLFIESLHEKYLFSERHFNGLIYIRGLGCAIQEFLVVNGKSKGTVWIDDMANSGGFTPSLNGQGSHQTFIDWLERVMEAR